jgi:hypothetical protein
MQRREFISLIGGALATVPSVARSQQRKGIPTAAYLWHAGSAAEEEPYFGAINEGFAKLGYIDDRCIVPEGCNDKNTNCFYVRSRSGRNEIG